MNRGGRGRNGPRAATGAIEGRVGVTRTIALGIVVVLLSTLLPSGSAGAAASMSTAAEPSVAAQSLQRDNADDSSIDRDDPWQPAPTPTPEGPSQEQASQHIIGGTPIAITERPWQVLISDETFGGSWCGGSILAANLILTAAHCVDNENLVNEQLLVVAGTDQWRDIDNGQWRFAKNVTVHPTYNPDGGFDGSQGLDLALIELTRPLTYNAAVQPIELADPTEAAASLGTSADLAGWGVDTIPAVDGATVTQLRNGVGEIISDFACGALIGRSLNGPVEMCLDTIATSQAGCFGDSGGGITVEINGVRKLLGVASFTILECAFNILVLAETATATSWIQANTPPITAGAGFVSGRVWDDINFDSIEGAQEGGLAGIEVTLSIPAPWPSDASPISLTAFTDADGRYSFVAPYGGWYEVSVTLDPMLVMSPPTGAGTEATNTDAFGRSRDADLVEPTTAYTTRFLLTPGYTETDIDFGATPGALVSGVVFDDLDRNGRRDAGEPLSAGVDGYIDAVRIDAAGLNRLIDFRYLVSADTFAMAVPPGDYYLALLVFEDRNVTMANRGDDAADNDFSPFTNLTEVFSVQAGQSYTFDLGLTPAGSGNVFADVANTDCDGDVSIIDALVIAQYTAGLRSDAATCPLPDPSTQINAANADMNLDGVTDIIDALLVSQCDAGLATPFCIALEG